MIGVFRFSVVIEGALEAAEGFDWDSGQVVVEMGTPMLQQMTRLFRQRPEDRPCCGDTCDRAPCPEAYGVSARYSYNYMREVPMPHLDLVQLTIWTLAGAAALSAFYIIAVFTLQHRWK